MKALKEVIEVQMEKMKPLKFYRFQIFVEAGDIFSKKKNVGVAHLKEGQGIYTIRLWTLLGEKFFLLPSREDSTKYLLMTRELNKMNLSKNKFFWNIVGNAQVVASKNVIEMNFDLLEKKVYMSLFPDDANGSQEPKVFGRK